MNREDVAKDLAVENNEVLRGRLEQAEALLKRAAEICTFNTPDEIVVLDIEAFLASQQGEQVKHPEQADGAQGLCRTCEGSRVVSDSDGCGVWYKACPDCAALAQPSPAPELEQPEVMAVLVLGGVFGGELGDNDIVTVNPSIERLQAELVTDGEVLVELMTVSQHDRLTQSLRYKAELYDEVWTLVTGKGYMNVTTAISKLEQELDAARDRVAELERKLKGQWTYASDQATHCGGCGKHKHTPLRVDWMGGYVCLTCIDEKLEALYEAAQAGQVPEGCAPGTYAIDYRDNWDGEGDRYFCIAEKTADGKWIRHESGQELLEYKGDAILAAWLLAASEAQERDK